MKTNFLKLCLVTTMLTFAGCAGKGPIITADGFKLVECVAAHYTQLSDAAKSGNLVTVAEEVAKDCGAESGQIIMDAFGSVNKGLTKAGLAK